MITLNDIRKLILQQEKELDNLIKSYFNQSLSTEVDLNSLKKEIQNAIETNNIEEAKILFEKYKMSTDTYNPEFYSIKGNIDIIESNFESALDNFLKGIELDNQNLDLLYNLGYLYSLIGDAENAIKYYRKCLDISKDEELNEEIKQLIEYEESKLSHTIITVNIDKKDEIFNYLNKQSNIISINERQNLKYQNKYYEDNISYCEVEKGKLIEMIDYFIRRNNNCILVTSSIDNTQDLLKFKDVAKVVYYPKTNCYLDNNCNVNENINIFRENKFCDSCDFIITDNISIYNYKKILEKRQNIYIINQNLSKVFDINYIVKNNSNIDNTSISQDILDYVKEIKEEYTKAMYILAGKFDENIYDCIELSKYIYDKYNTKEILYLYLNMLKDTKDYDSIIYLILNTKYCDDVYKAEIIYLNASNNLECVNFIVDIICKNYNQSYLLENKDYEYKNAILNFELDNYNVAYEESIKVINKETYLCNSPLINRNLSYLLNTINNINYIKHYNLYKELVNEILS